MSDLRRHKREISSSTTEGMCGTGPLVRNGDIPGGGVMELQCAALDIRAMQKFRINN